MTLVQGTIREAIQRVATIQAAEFSQGRLRLWIGPPHSHRSSWFDVSEGGEIEASTRGAGLHLFHEVTLETIPQEAARLVAWVL